MARPLGRGPHCEFTARSKAVRAVGSDRMSVWKLPGASGRRPPHIDLGPQFSRRLQEIRKEARALGERPFLSHKGSTRGCGRCHPLSGARRSFLSTSPQGAKQLFPEMGRASPLSWGPAVAPHRLLRRGPNSNLPPWGGELGCSTNPTPFQRQRASAQPLRVFRTFRCV